MSASTLGTWIDAHLNFIIIVVCLLWVVPLLNGFQRQAIPSLPSTSLWPGARFYSSFVAVAFTIVFVQSLVHAIERHSVLPHDGSFSWHAIGYVAVGWLWCTFWFWATMLGFIAARKG